MKKRKFRELRKKATKTITEKLFEEAITNSVLRDIDAIGEIEKSKKLTADAKFIVNDDFDLKPKKNKTTIKKEDNNGSFIDIN